MKTGTILLWGAIGILLVQVGCKEADVTGPGSAVTRKITGTVVQKVGNTPIDNAIVQNVIGVGGSDTTKNGGQFSLSYSLTSGLDVKLVGTYPGLRNDTASFRLETAADTSITLRLDTTSSTILVTPTSGKPSSISLVSNEVGSIAIRGSGLKENTLIVFEVHDSVGNPVLGTNRPTVKFTLLGNTGGGEYLYPTQMQTDPSTGRVFTKLISGTRAGVVQVGAATTNDSVKSGNVRVTIAGGLPHRGHFSLSREKANIAGGIFDNLNARFTVIIGDRYGNPTQPTQVYFTTTGGIITATATTDANGTASAQLTTTNPRPPIAIITATTIGDTTGNPGDSVISQQVRLVLSAQTSITVPASGFIVPDSGSYTFNYQVSDVNGNPLVAGTTISVSLTGGGAADLDIQGTKEFTMPDVDSSFTNFSATIVDKVRGGTGGLFNVLVDVKSPNGNLTKSSTGQSTGGTGGGGGTVSSGGTPQYVNPVGTPKTSLTVNEGGDVSSSSTSIAFEVTDSAGGRLGPTAFNPNGSIKVAFSAVHFSGGNAGTFTTTVDSTDEQGLVHAHFTAGNKSGIVRIFASVFSNPNVKGFADVVISGGFPDSNGISYSLDKQNMPGLVKAGALGSVALQMTDQFGNPAKQTDIYFTTDGGNIQAKAQSSTSGSVTVALQGGAPAPSTPSPGRGFVRARLFGKDSVRIEKPIPFMFSGAPIILGPAGGFTIQDSGVYSFNYEVQDANGNPLSGGTTIQVAASGPGSSSLEVIGGSFSLPDTRDTNLTNFSATVSDKVLGGASGAVTITITTTGDNGTTSYSFTGTLVSTASGGGGVGGGGFASSIELVSVSRTAVSVRGTGAGETAFLSWVLKDSNGVAITQAKSDTVVFAINGGPGGGEFMSPGSAISDATGKVSGTFNSGTKAGVVQVSATATIGSRTLTSAPVSITMFGGLPDSTRLSVSTTALNYFPGSGGSIGTVNVQLGDKYNNPVQPGTAVYFTTTGGLIDASGYTDAAGHASAALYGGNPFPVGGIDTITVRTVGENGVPIVKSHIITFSGPTKIFGPANGFSISDSGAYAFNFQVQDANGNPLSAGTAIQLTVSGAGSSTIEFVSGQSTTLPDTRDTNLTNLSATIRDNTLSGASGPITVTIGVVSPNGNATYSFTGNLLSSGGGGGGGGTNGIPKFVNAISTSRTDLNVFEGGSTTSSSTVITFEVTDSSGIRLGSNTLGGANNIKVAFSSVFNPNGGSTGTFTTSFDSTDAQGLVRAQFTAGNKSGVVRIWAKTQTVPVISGYAEIVISGGFPDSNHISLQLDKLNLAPGGGGVVSMQMADQFGNPAKTTNVYFASDGGSIQSSAISDASGRLSVSLLGGPPVPTNPTAGRGFVTAYLFGKDSTRIQKKVPFLFSGAPLVLMPAGGFVIADSGSYALDFQVQDSSGNPLAAGTTINVTASGAGSSDLIFSPASFLISDTRDTNATNFSILVQDSKTRGASGQVNLTVSATGPNGATSGSISGTLLVTGTIGGTTGGSGYAATIRALRTSIDPSKSLSIRQGGGVETAQITFQVLDTLGNPIDLNHKDTVTFTLQNAPGGGEFVTPATAITDPTGLAVTSISSGTKAGIVQVVASLTAGAVTITSNPVQFSIESGAPDSNHITVFVQDASHFIRSNLPGLSTAGQLGFVRTLMADKYGNPAKNRLVRFYTNGGFIDPSQTTNDAGVAEAQIYGGNPNPSGGADTVTVETLGENGVLIRKTAVLTFSGAPVITTTNVPVNDTVTVFDGGFTDVNYKVLDANGNPLAANNAITVSVSGTVSSQIFATSDVFVNTIDSRNALDGNFKVRLSDQSPGGGTSGDFTVTISSTGPNGTSNRRFYGHLNAPSAINPPSPTAKNPAQIAFLGVSNTDISVAGTGANENTVLTYEVRDSLGSPVDKDHRAIAQFTLQFFPNSFAASGTYPHLIPTTDSTDEQGKLRVSLVSGTTSGVVQVVTTVNLPGGAQLKTSPVRINVNAGFPDQRHFTLAGEKHNFPGLDKAFVTMDYTVGVSDKYSNPVQSGTSVYWHSTHGTMQTATSSTDINGFVTKKLFSANPLPTGADSISLGQGWGRVYAQTFGDSANAIIDSFAVLWTGAPVTTKTSGVGTFAIADGGSAGPWTFTVTDRLGHPLSAGTQITVTATEGSVDGDANNTLFDTTVGGSGITSFTVILSDADIGDANAPKNCILKVSVGHPVYGTYQTILATGTVD